jgi:hypothetical protein
MPGMGWSALLNSPQPTADGTALASSVTLTDISQASPGSVTTPANFLYPGSAFRVTAFGVFSNTATPTLLLGVYYGGVAGVALATTGAITTTTTVTNVPWHLELYCTVRTAGASGTVKVHGWCDLGTSVSAVSHLPMPNTANTGTATIDTTAAKLITIGAQWGTSSASNTITCHHSYVQSLAL